MKEIIDDILKCKFSGKVLDLGCEDAPVDIELLDKGFEVTCVDISEDRIRQLPEMIK